MGRVGRLQHGTREQFRTCTNSEDTMICFSSHLKAAGRTAGSYRRGHLRGGTRARKGGTRAHNNAKRWSQKPGKKPTHTKHKTGSSYSLTHTVWCCFEIHTHTRRINPRPELTVHVGTIVLQSQRGPRGVNVCVISPQGCFRAPGGVTVVLW